LPFFHDFLAHLGPGEVLPSHCCPFLPSLAPIGQAVSEEIFLTLANQKKELILVAMFVGQIEPNEDAL
jgi:hypothetical protein